MNDILTRRLIGIQELSIVAGNELSRITEATPLGLQAGEWRAMLSRIVSQLEDRINERLEGQ